MSDAPQSPSRLIAEIQARLAQFTHGKEELDDITLYALIDRLGQTGQL